MERLRQRMKLAKRAVELFSEVLQIEDPSTVERDASLQRFEYSFEATWKFAKQYLRTIEGIDIGSPKGVIRSCRELGFFNDEDAMTALEMVDDRNLTVHTYNEELAEEIYQKLNGYHHLLLAWLERLSERM